MKILIITNYDLGLYKFRRELIERLVQLFEVFISVPIGDFKDKLEALGCKIVPIEFNRRGTNPFADLNQIKQYKQLIDEIKPDVVLTYTIKPNVYGGLACQSKKVPYIANVTGLGTSIENGGLLSVITKILYKIGLRKASCVFFQNKPNHDLFSTHKIVKGNTRVIPGSGVNLEEHCVEAYPDEINGVRFLFIGRIMKDKGIDELLDAIHHVKDKYSNTTLAIVGGYDEDYSERLQLEEDNGYIKYYGSQPSVHEFIQQSHCTVLPSYHEGTANVLLESASTGRPVIATRVTGCIETFDEGITGFGCDVSDAQSLADSMLKFIELTHEQKVVMGMAGRKKMELQYDRRIVIDSYLEEIKKIINK